MYAPPDQSLAVQSGYSFTPAQLPPPLLELELELLLLDDELDELLEDELLLELEDELELLEELDDELDPSLATVLTSSEKTLSKPESARVVTAKK